MTFNEYQQDAIQLSLHAVTKTAAIDSPAFITKLLGLVGEAGEVAEKFKKILRDKNGEITSEDID